MIYIIILDSHGSRMEKSLPITVFLVSENPIKASKCVLWSLHPCTASLGTWHTTGIQTSHKMKIEHNRENLKLDCILW